MWKRARWPFWLALGTVAFAATGIWVDLSKADWAAWVQAVGSVVAIGAAIAVARRQAEQGRDLLERQRKQQESAAFDAHTKFLQNTRQVIASAYLAIGRMGTNGQAVTGDKRYAALADFAAVSEVLQRVEIGRLDDFDFIDALCHADAAMRKLILTIQTPPAPTFREGWPADPDPLGRIAKELKTNLDARVQDLQKKINRRIDEEAARRVQPGAGGAH